MSAGAASVLDVRTPDQIKADVTGQVNADATSQEAPLQSQVGTLGSQRDSAVKAIGDMFSNLQPYVSGQADKLAADYQGTEQTQQQIYSAANQRLAALKNERAQSAQALAQQMGGPVAVGEFTQGVDPAAESYANLGAGEQLHTLGYAAADVGQARSFAGKVFPLVQTEQQAQARQHFEDQIKTIKDQISTIEAGKSSAVNKGVSDAMLAERNFALQRTQQALDKVKAGHDWQATLHTLKNDDARLKIAQNQLGLQTKSTNASIKLNQQKLTTQQKQFAQQLGLSKQQILQRQQQLDQSARLANQRIALANKQYSGQILDAAVNPKPGKTITYSQAVEVPAAAALTGKVKGAYSNPKSSTGYSQLITVHQASVTAPITDPNQLVDYLVAHSVGKAQAVKMVKSRLSLPDTWTYHAPKTKKKK